MDQTSTPEASCGQANINLYKKRFGIDFYNHFDPSAPPWGLEIHEHRIEIGTEIAALLDTASDHIWTPPGRLLASILDQFGLGLVSKPSFKMRAVFTMILSAILCTSAPLLGPGKS